MKKFSEKIPKKKNRKKIPWRKKTAGKNKMKKISIRCFLGW